MEKFKVLVGLLAISALLTGCLTQITLPRYYHSLYPLYVASYPEIDIDASGVKHFTWREGVKILYSHTFMGDQTTPFEFEPLAPWDEYYRPDIAVRDNGDVFLVWNEIDNDTPGSPSIKACWYKIHAGEEPVNVCNPLYDFSTYSTAGPTKLATNGDEVYAVYAIRGGDDLTLMLRYIQLEPLNASGGYVLQDSGEWWSGEMYAAAVEPNGTLHVAWASMHLVDNLHYVAHYSNHGVTGNMIQHYKSAEGTDMYLNIALAIDPDDDGTPDNDYVYMAYTKNTPADHDMIYIRVCNQNGCTSGTQVTANMNSALEWDVTDLQMVANSTTAYLIYSGNVGTATDTDIFIFNYAGGDLTTSAPTQITTDDIDQVSPRVALVSGTPFYAWITKPIDVYVYHYLLYMNAKQPIQIYQHRNEYGPQYLGLAGRGDYAAGIWIDDYTNGIGDAPLVSFNANQQFIPVVWK